MIELSLVSGVGQSAPYAMVVLAEHLRPQLGDSVVRANVSQALGTLLREVNGALADYEQLRMIVVAREPWSVENGMLTPTLKIRRSRIEAEFEAQLAHWYASQGPVHWA
jgi:long-chain acyl-CoA synthetase